MAKKIIEIPNQFKIVNPVANIDSLYGVYNNIQEALDATRGLRSKGRVVGIFNDEGFVEEYIFQGGIEDIHLIPKTSRLESGSFVQGEGITLGGDLSNRLIKSGDLIVGIKRGSSPLYPLPLNGQNLNEVITPSYYLQPNNNNNIVNNYPVTSGGILNVYNGSIGLIQEYIYTSEIDSGRYVRTLVSNVWNPWIKIGGHTNGYGLFVNNDKLELGTKVTSSSGDIVRQIPFDATTDRFRIGNAEVGGGNSGIEILPTKNTVVISNGQQNVVIDKKQTIFSGGTGNVMIDISGAIPKIKYLGQLDTPTIMSDNANLMNSGVFKESFGFGLSFNHGKNKAEIGDSYTTDANGKNFHTVSVTDDDFFKSSGASSYVVGTGAMKSSGLMTIQSKSITNINNETNKYILSTFGSDLANFKFFTPDKTFVNTGAIGTPAATFTDTTNGGGIHYAGDYTAKFTTRSIVDKGYVDHTVATNVEMIVPEITALKSDVGTLKTDNTKNKNDITAIKTDVGNLKTDNTANKTKISNLETDIAQVKGDITNINGSIGTINTDLDAIESSVATLKTDNTSNKSRLTALETKTTNTDNEITTIKGNITQANTDISNINSTIGVIQGDVSGLSASVGTLRSDLTTTNNNVTAVSNKVKDGVVNLGSANKNVTTAETGDLNTKFSTYVGMYNTGTTNTPEGAAASAKQWAVWSLGNGATGTGQFAMAVGGNAYTTNSLFFRERPTLSWNTIWTSRDFTQAKITAWDGAVAWGNYATHGLGSGLATNNPVSTSSLNDRKATGFYRYANTALDLPSTFNGSYINLYRSDSNTARIAIDDNNDLYTSVTPTNTWKRMWNTFDFTQNDVNKWKVAGNIAPKAVTLDTEQTITGYKKYTKGSTYSHNNNHTVVMRNLGANTISNESQYIVEVGSNIPNTTFELTLLVQSSIGNDIMTNSLTIFGKSSFVDNVWSFTEFTTKLLINDPNFKKVSVATKIGTSDSKKYFIIEVGEAYMFTGDKLSLSTSTTNPISDLIVSDIINNFKIRGISSTELNEYSIYSEKPNETFGFNSPNNGGLPYLDSGVTKMWLAYNMGVGLEIDSATNKLGYRARIPYLTRENVHYNGIGQMATDMTYPDAVVGKSGVSGDFGVGFGLNNTISAVASNSFVAGKNNVLKSVSSFGYGEGNIIDDGCPNNIVMGKSLKVEMGAPNNTLFGSSNTVAQGSQHNLVYGSGNSISQNSSLNLLGGSTNIVTQGTRNSIISGDANTIKVGSSSLMVGNNNESSAQFQNTLLSGYKNYLMGSVVNSVISGDNNSISGADSSFITGKRLLTAGTITSSVVFGSDNSIAFQSGFVGGVRSGRLSRSGGLVLNNLVGSTYNTFTYGESNNNTGISSTVFGMGNITNNSNVFVIGVLNDPVIPITNTGEQDKIKLTSPAFIIGNGGLQNLTTDYPVYDDTKRSNALVVRYNGDIESNGTLKISKLKINALNTAPASATDTGTVGEIRVTDSHVYVCTGVNEWKRAELTTW